MNSLYLHKESTNADLLKLALYSQHRASDETALFEKVNYFIPLSDIRPIWDRVAYYQRLFISLWCQSSVFSSGPQFHLSFVRNSEERGLQLKAVGCLQLSCWTSSVDRHERESLGHILFRLRLIPPLPIITTFKHLSYMIWDTVWQTLGLIQWILKFVSPSHSVSSCWKKFLVIIGIAMRVHYLELL
jgi:hypothetical protein